MHLLKPSFAGGELSPALYGRTDLAKYDVGAARLQNFLVLRYGGVANRAGTKFVSATSGGKKAVLLSFRYSSEQNYIVEITAGKIRFYLNKKQIMDGASPYEIDNDYTEAELSKIKYTQSADVMFLVHPSHPPMTLTRYTSTNWVFERMDITGGPLDDYLAYGPGDTIRRTAELSYKIPGTYYFKFPDSVTEAFVRLAGAGGGGMSSSGDAERQHVGGDGEYLETKFDVESKEITIVVGAGGTSGITMFLNPHEAKPGGASKVSSASTSVTARGGGAANDNHDGVSYGGGGAGCSGGRMEMSGNTIIVRDEKGGDGWVNIRYTYVAPNTTTITPSATTGSVTLTASNDLFSTNDVNNILSLHYYIPSSMKKGNPLNADLAIQVLPGATVYVESFGFWNGNFSLQKYDNDDNTWKNVRTQDGNRSQNYNFTETNHDDSIVSYRVTSTAFDTSVWSGENEKQRGYVTIQAFGNDYYGQILITSFTDAKHVEGKVKKALPSLDATSQFAFGAWDASKGYPCCAGFFEDRLIFAGTKSKPQTFWTSKTGDYYNFATSTPLVDNDAITASVNGGQMNEVKSIVAFGELILMTSGGEYKVTGGQKPISPTNVMSKAQEYRGISDVSPVTIGSRIIYVQEQGTIVRDLSYSYEADKYTGDDLNLLASHLFERHKIVDMAYQQIPNSIVWCVRDDGILLGMTYLKEQDVYAWHQHNIAGAKVKSICCISGEEEDELWLVVERDGIYYVECMEQRDKSATSVEQYFVDSGVSVHENKSLEITGLEHLEGHEVAILADGNVLPRQIVEGGKITLDRVYSTVHAGLPIAGVVETLPVEFTAQDGSYQGRKKRISDLMLMFKDSRGGRFGLKESALDEIKWRASESFGQAIELYTGKKSLKLPNSSWEETLKIVVRQDDPLPITILSIVPKVEAGG